jgi:hypothetical protein
MIRMFDWLRVWQGSELETLYFSGLKDRFGVTSLVLCDFSKLTVNKSMCHIVKTETILLT